MPMTIHRSQLAAYIAHAPAIPADKDRSEVRVYATIITAGVFGSFVFTALFILSGEPNPLRLVAMMRHQQGLFGAAFALLACGVAPHLFDLLFRPHKLRAKHPRKMASASMVAAGMLWGMLATVARPLDLGFIPVIFWATAFAYLLVGGAYGYSLNAQLASEENEKVSTIG